MLDSITQTTSLAAEWQIARKARLARFAEAAARLSERQTRPVLVNVERISAPEQNASVRREYETANRPSSYTPIARRILRVVAREFDVTIDDMISARRLSPYCLARYVATGIFLEMTRMSFGAIGKQLGGRDHSTIFQSQPKFWPLFAQEAFRNRIDQMKADILEGRR